MNIKEQIFGNQRKQELKEEDLITIHDRMMVEYGWIPLKEFRTLPIPSLFNLLDRIQKRHEEENKAMNKKGRR